MAEQQEEYISNTLLKKIEALKNEKEQLARNYEQEEEFLTNDLSRKLLQVFFLRNSHYNLASVELHTGRFYFIQYSCAIYRVRTIVPSYYRIGQ